MNAAINPEQKMQETNQHNFHMSERTHDPRRVVFLCVISMIDDSNDDDEKCGDGLGVMGQQ